MSRPSVSIRPARILRVLTAAAGPLLLAGCGLNGPQSTFHVQGPVARSQLDLFMLTVYVTAFIFVAVGGALAFATLRFKARSAAAEQAEPPPQSHGNPLVEAGLVGASILCLVVIAIPTLRAIIYTYEVPAAAKAGAYEITATGTQWWFKFEYPGEQIADVGPLVTANELVIPAGRPVHIDLRTLDVIHSFWVPKLAGKVDMIPNRANHLWLQADAPGYYYGQCAEFCGDSHALMRFRVIALPPGAFAAWLENQKRPARAAAAAAAADPGDRPRVIPADYRLPAPAAAGAALAGSPEFDADPFAAWQARQRPDPARENPALIAEGRRLFQEKTCIACHTIRGQEGIGVTGPDLTHVGARTTIAAGALENTPARMRAWITDPEHFKPGNKMFNGGYADPATGQRLIQLNDGEIGAIVAYLQSLK